MSAATPDDYADHTFPRRVGSALSICPVCRMKAPRKFGECVMCVFLGKSAPMPRGARGGGRRAGKRGDSITGS